MLWDRRVAAFGAALLAPLLAPRARAQAPAPVTVRIHVAAPSGDPIVGADVAILDDAHEQALFVATTDRAGNHTFTFAPDSARYRIAVRKLGFVSTTRRLLVQPNDTITVDLRLISADAVQTLPTVVTRENYHIAQDPGYWEGFAQRCSSPNVACTTGDSLATHPNNIDAYFNRIPGVAPVEAAAGTTPMPKMYGPFGECVPSVFVNGFQMPGPDTAWRDVMSFSPSALKGVEVYPFGQPRPLRFRGDPGCGAYVLWLK